MAKIDFSKAFAKFANNEVKTAKIEALDGAEVKYRELTMTENDAFTNRLIKGVDKHGEAEIDYAEANEIKYEKAAMILVEPKMTVEDLKALPASASEAINEINALAEAQKDDIAGSEGNLED